MSLTRIVNLLQTTLFVAFCVVGWAFLCVDIHWFYLLSREAAYAQLFQHPNGYELIWYLDCWTFVLMYLWLAVKLLRVACNPKQFGKYVETEILPTLLNIFNKRIRPLVTFDTVFKLIIVAIALVVVKHSLGYEFKISRLHIVSDIRPMANIFWDIYCPLMWLKQILLF